MDEERARLGDRVKELAEEEKALKAEEQERRQELNEAQAARSRTTVTIDALCRALKELGMPPDSDVRGRCRDVPERREVAEAAG